MLAIWALSPRAKRRVLVRVGREGVEGKAEGELRRSQSDSDGLDALREHWQPVSEKRPMADVARRWGGAANTGVPSSGERRPLLCDGQERSGEDDRALRSRTHSDTQLPEIMRQMRCMRFSRRSRQANKFQKTSRLPS